MGRQYFSLEHGERPDAAWLSGAGVKRRCAVAAPRALAFARCKGVVAAIFALLITVPAAAQDRQIVTASEPEALTLTVYRDPNRRPSQQLNRNWPRGFAMISETRRVILPPGRSTIRFDGVSEGMIAVSAIVTGLPGGTIEKNRNADLLGPAALVDGTLGNRVTITRTNPATGAEESEGAIVRTRADGGLVLQTGDGYEAVRCSGLPERLSFDSIPGGLSAQPVFTVDTVSDTGGTYTVTLIYLSWGFDWQADYVATVDEGRTADDVRFDLTSWLTVLNDNGQSFANAELMAVAGTLNIVSNFRRLASPPAAAPLQLSCWPIGSTAAGTPIDESLASGLIDRAEGVAITVTGTRLRTASADAAPPPPPPPPVIAGEENLGDLKLYRIPVPMDVNAQGLKQVMFLREEGIEGAIIYEAGCQPLTNTTSFEYAPASMMLETVNQAESGLGVALPSGTIAVFERTGRGEFLIGEEQVRDFAAGQDVEVPVGLSNQVFAACRAVMDRNTSDWASKWTGMETAFSNANPHSVTIRLEMGSPIDWDVRGQPTMLRGGQHVLDVQVPANRTRTVRWDVRSTRADAE